MTTSFAEKRPRTASRAVRRQQLIEATIECIAENGLSGTTMAEVTRRAGLSLGLVSFHFRSKENLLQETLVYLAEEHRSRWVESLEDSALDPAAKLAAVMDAHFHPSTCNHTRIAVWFAFFGEARHRDVYRAKIASFDNERTDTVTRMCEALRDRENVSVPAEDIASNLESLADGLWLSILLYPGWLDRRQAKAQLHSYLRSVFPHAFSAWPGEIETPATPRIGASA
ncbi:MAG: transcriptional regulator BetI [Pseudomonadota bacterium]